MIEKQDGLFCLHTAATTMLLRCTEFGHLELVHYGARVTTRDTEALAVKNSSAYGCCVNYSESDPVYSLDTLPLAFSGAGRGDYRESPVALLHKNGSSSDFIYRRSEVIEGSVPAEGLPGARGGD